MIRKEELYQIGRFNKPHGVHGELLFTFTDDVFERVDCDYLVCLIDGIFVPFYISEYRFKSNNTALVILDGIATVERARMLVGVDVFFPLKYIKEEQKDELSLQYLVGFSVNDVAHGLLGVIKEVDDSTTNVLFSVENEQGKQLLVPAQNELISDIDYQTRTITFDLPEGLVTINHE
ncbi:MAG: 16S rRNA processing protein RimM [Bacteroidales bacterium]|nr:16S rRNA processing protein RimM [Bacteroidales bacterium]